MLKRQRVLLTILSEAKTPMSHIALVKAAFLIRLESEFGKQSAFYDFLPYKFGPFSFALYRELASLKRDGYVIEDQNTFRLSPKTKKQTKEQVGSLPDSWRKETRKIVNDYFGASQDELLGDVYRRFPWFSINSELTHLKPKGSKRPCATVAVYTVGYERKSVDSFFNGLLEDGIQNILDVRANPISRKYGFARKSMSEIARKLGIEYTHMPSLGISSADRSDLTDFDSYQRLLDRYENEMLPSREEEVDLAVDIVTAQSTALLCMEADVRCCHRGRLANAIASKTKLPITHI